MAPGDPGWESQEEGEAGLYALKGGGRLEIRMGHRVGVLRENWGRGWG